MATYPLAVVPDRELTFTLARTAGTPEASLTLSHPGTTYESLAFKVVLVFFFLLPARLEMVFVSISLGTVFLHSYCKQNVKNVSIKWSNLYRCLPVSLAEARGGKGFYSEWHCFGAPFSSFLHSTLLIDTSPCIY